MSSSTEWVQIALSAGIVAFGVALYLGKSRVARRRHDEIRSQVLLAALRDASSLKPLPKAVQSGEVERMERPVYELTAAILAHLGTRVERVDPHHAPGSSDSVWLLLAAGEDNIGDRLEVSTLENDGGRWAASYVETFKFQRPVIRWITTGSMDEVVKDVSARLTNSSKQIEVRAATPMTRNEYRINLLDVRKMSEFVAAFNDGLIERAGGRWNGQSWDAFNDYLSWPSEETYSLLLDGWSHCRALNKRDLAIFEEVLAANPHVSVRRT